MNTSGHWSDDVHYLVARFDRVIVRLRLEFAGGTPATADLTPCGTSAELRLVFAGTLIPPGRVLTGVSAWDASGQCRERIPSRSPPSPPG